LNILIFTAQLIVLFFILYQLIFAIIGIAAQPKSSTHLHKLHKFALLIPAHNESSVVGQLLSNLKQLGYPSHLYDIYVICDNCTDNTAEIARNHGAYAYERTHKTKRSKGYALQWMFEKLWILESLDRKYDAVAIIDADNLVSSNFLQVMNQKLHKHEVIQAYLDTKNPHDTWITKSFAYSFWLSSRNLQLSRESLNLSGQLGGTGMVISTQVLKELGWETDSLTEDLEFTSRYILHSGKRVAFAHEAKIYDEKPLSFKASWSQRLRWTIGHIDCMLRLSKEMWKQILFYFDALMYLLQPLKTLFVSIVLIGSVLLLLFTKAPDDYLSPYILITSVILYYIMPIFTLIREKKAFAIKWLPLSYLFSLSWIALIIVGFIKRNEKEWSHTEHGRVLDKNELKNIATSGK
jgi:cellulose synthase/poly-beta-1,6-N-acetylglucosamine synthase-like glycosyltransferase